MYKVSKGMSLPQITQLFSLRNEQCYNLRHNAEVLQPFVNYVHCGTRSISYWDPKIWVMVSDTYKNVDSLYNFKKVIKKWKSENCPCRIYCQILMFLSKIKGFVKLLELLCFLGQYLFFVLYFEIQVSKTFIK